MTYELPPQCQRVLDRLRRGEATSDDLSAIAANHRSVIHKLRQYGHDITSTMVSRTVTYALKVPSVQVPRRGLPPFWSPVEDDERKRADWGEQ